VINAAAAVWIVYDVTTAPELPGWAVQILQYILLDGALIGLADSIAKYLSDA
jgi:hypothetical protein